MKAERICSWCEAEGIRNVMGEAETKDGSPTHGICGRHLRIERKKLSEIYRDRLSKRSEDARYSSCSA